MIEIIGQQRNSSSFISDCIAALDVILFQLEQEKEVPSKTIEQLKKAQGYFNELINGNTPVNSQSLEALTQQTEMLKALSQEEIGVKLNVVFLPYKASMWDSLATVYEAAVKDENCVARVVPIPYYQLSQNEAIPTYEGERFPAHVPITHYNEYNLEEEEPDIIFIHNIYDDYNTITRVHEHFFTSNLKRFTDMLVYVPYHVSTFIQKGGDGDRSYNLPSVVNVDKIVVLGQYIKEAAIRDGVPEEKLLALGSPKLDVMSKVINKELSYPDEWNERIEGKTVYLLNTGCLYFGENPLAKLERLTDLLHFPRYIENSVVIWRPHPLTKICIQKYTPFLMEYYIDLTERRIPSGSVYNHVIFDQTDDYMPALQAADVLISYDGSLLRSFLLTEKKVLFWGPEMPEGSLLPKDAFYYAFDPQEPWYEHIKKFANGIDPLAEKRKGIVSQMYANADGTSGQKVYETIKQCVLQEG